AKTAIRESYKNLDQSIYFLDRLVRCQKDAQLLFCMMWYLPPYKGTQSVMRISKSGQSSIVWESQRGRKGLFKKSLTDSEYAELKNGLKDLKLQQVLPLQRASENNLLVGITYYIGNDFHVYTFHDGVPRSLRTLLDVVTRKYSGVTPRSHVAPWYYEPGHER
ncbi:MAG: hypothetical protein QF473_14170, partial [Planctomycetota bacterium]|nr:hypothetical protein [Planctomycetota bacterium]